MHGDMCKWNIRSCFLSGKVTFKTFALHLISSIHPFCVNRLGVKLIEKVHSFLFTQEAQKLYLFWKEIQSQTEDMFIP